MHNLDPLPPLDGLNALLAAAEAGSFTGAAEMLGITHGSVSRRIAVLEAWLGTSLFDRHGRGVRLTPAGQRFAADARQALGTLSRSADQWRPRRGRPTVRLAVVPSFARLWLLPRLARLERGDIHVEVLMDHRPTDLDAQEADLAVRYGRGWWEGLDARLLFGETLRPAAAPALAAELGSDAAPEALLRRPLLHDSDVSHWRAWLTGAGIRYRPRWQDRRFEDYDSVLVAAEAGLGVALLRAPFAETAIAAGRLAYVAPRAEPNPAGHYACLRAGETRAAVIELADRLLALAVDGA
ncbi:LysR substrate-binding domain-containing protein [Sphingosinicella sp. LHD-64]|uniref:LysR substrate-binding domain-containing protein n=1 Tax=Sphingosinicella sp. LHD-64 TaxID=3072139 RepID=UPI00280C9458|nr:LysR substrate-binding domain-containing protein [Sphingosinicella sp. LHD-64]MDQ8755325.1 LysR substrate-binding domain-containing protein [Sphingosinicella sp. LHD-64]